ELLWLRPGNASEVRIPLADAAGAVCWMGPGRVAVSLRQADHRVEIWDLGRRARTVALGTETPIAAGLGATRLREVQLRYDFNQRLLYTLESFTGDLEVWKDDGTLAFHATVGNPGREPEEKRLRTLDHRLRALRAGTAEAVSSLYLGAAMEGGGWVAQSFDDLAHSVTLIRVSAAGSVAHTVTGVGCPSRSFTLWGRMLVFYRDIAVPREVCNSVVRLP
nr:hypothetical protein [Acidobacteriota bacterium]